MFFTLLNPSLITLSVQTVVRRNSYNCFLVALLLAESNQFISRCWFFVLNAPWDRCSLCPHSARGQAAVTLQRCRALSQPQLVDLHLADRGSNVKVSSTGQFQITWRWVWVMWWSHLEVSWGSQLLHVPKLVCGVSLQLRYCCTLHCSSAIVGSDI